MSEELPLDHSFRPFWPKPEQCAVCGFVAEAHEPAEPPLHDCGKQPGLCESTCDPEPAPEPKPWVCSARTINTDPPQDCDWPGCGCDPYANKVLEALEEARIAPQPAPEPNYPCADCGAPRTEAQGGTVFTVCDTCWDKHWKKEPAPEPSADAGELAQQLHEHFADEPAIYVGSCPRCEEAARLIEAWAAQREKELKRHIADVQRANRCLIDAPRNEIDKLITDLQQRAQAAEARAEKARERIRVLEEALDRYRNVPDGVDASWTADNALAALAPEKP
jgi:ssDNA-binding Zn-finger/Zn-ribbon topoisomerase 1